MQTLLTLIGLALVGYPTLLLLRFQRERLYARQAITRLADECNHAKLRAGEIYNLEYRYPELLNQIVHEMQDLGLSLQGSMLLMGSTTFRQKMHWDVVRDYRDVVKYADKGIQELKNAAFMAQFPRGSRILEKVTLNGIPVRER